MSSEVGLSVLMRSPAGRRTDPHQWPLERKLALVLEGLRGHRPVTEICREVGISTSRYYQWRDQFLQAGREGLAQSEPDRRKLEERVHQLEAENAVLRTEKELFQSVCLED